MALHNRSSRSPSLSTANLLEDDCTSRSIEVTYSDYENWRSDNRRNLLNHSLLPISTDESPESHAEYTGTFSHSLLNRRGRNRESALQKLTDSVEKGTTDHEMIFHHEHQLMVGVEEIYATLAKMEKECISFHKSQLMSRAEMSDSEWQRHIIRHESLLNRYENVILVFVKSHIPSAGLLLKQFCGSRRILARMWRHGIFVFLEILRQRYPNTVEHIIRFINSAYSTIIRLSGNVSLFRDTWNEQLGDLARYRMAMESSDGQDRQHWAIVATDWYNRVAYHVPDEGRIKHHLAVMAHPDALQQLFYYTTALVSVRPYYEARRQLKGLLDSHNGQYFHPGSAVSVLLAAHGVLLSHGMTEEIIILRKNFLSLMQAGITVSDRRGLRFVYIMSSNFASLLEYGALESIVAAEFRNKRKDLISAYADALNWTASKAVHEKRQNASQMDTPSRIIPWLAFEGGSLAFHTLKLLLNQMGDHDVCLGVHISLAFIWCLALHPLAIEQVEQIIPWSEIVQYLNSLLSPSIIFPKIEDESFPQLEDIKIQQLPEDFLIQGQLWSRLYYPEGFFEGAPFEHERPHIKEYSMVVVRTHRCLWLAVRLSTVSNKFELIWEACLRANFHSECSSSAG